MQHKIAKVIKSFSYALICFFFSPGVYLHADDVNVIETYLNDLLITNQLNDPTGDLRNILLFLQSDALLLPPGTIDDALVQLQPSWYGDLAWSTEYSLTNASRIISNNILTRVREYNSCSVCDSQNICLPYKNFWVAALGGYLRQNGLRDLPAFRSKDCGVITGFDFVLSDWLILGITGGYTHTNLRWNNLGGSNSIQNFYVGPYCAWSCGRWTVEASLLKGNQRFRSDRHVKFSFVNRRTKNTHYGDSVVGHLGTTVNYCWGPLDFAPYLLADYVYLNVNGAKEKGAHHLDLRIKSNSPQFFQGEIGAALSGTYNVNAAIVVPTVQVGFQNITPTANTDITASLHGQPGSFVVKTTEDSIYQWTAGLFLNIYCQDWPDISFSYNGESGSKRWAYLATGEINWSF